MKTENGEGNDSEEMANAIGMTESENLISMYKIKMGWAKKKTIKPGNKKELLVEVHGKTSATTSLKETQTHLLFPTKEDKFYTPPSVVKFDVAEKHAIIVNSIDSMNNLPLVTVKFYINKEVFASAFKESSTVRDIKESLINVLDLDEDIITIKKDNITVETSLTLADLGARVYRKISFQITSSKGEEGLKTITAKVKENIPSVDVITVHLGEWGAYRDIVAEIENQTCQKEWLGGYRNKFTNILYHHAATQTSPNLRKVFEYTESGDAIPLLYHRDTQTPFRPKDITVDTTVNKSTQMCRTDLYITANTDKIMTARPYQTYEKWYKENNNEQAVLIIQRSVRNWIKGKRIRNLIYLQRSLRDDMKKQKAQILKEQADKERANITNAAYPVKRDDFYMLYLMVGQWWKREWKTICDLRSAEPKKAASVLLLKKEVKLLENIEKHRIVGKQEALKKERTRFLERTARPLTFKNSKGRMTSIDDPDTQKARFFKEYHTALFRKDVHPRDRINLLFILKQMFTTYFLDYIYVNDIVSLVQREIDLLLIGTKMKDLKVLHKRIEQLYMNFIEQKEFNPKAGRYKKPNLPKTLDTLFRCTRCLKLLPASKYPVHVRLTAYTECKSCIWLQNIGHQRKDMSPYLKLLTHIRNLEMEKCCYSSVCFLLQPIGMSFLTNGIWHGHSAISECNDISKLQHVRWLPDVEWAPWNTILLTNQEAKCHVCIPDVFAFYGEAFIESVRQKHILARLRFIPLLKMDHDFRVTGVWSNIQDDGPFLHPSHAENIAAENEYDQL